MPESPVWLCTQERYEDALISLIWLRGWKYNEHIKTEYEQLINYCKQNRSQQTPVDMIETGNKEISTVERGNFQPEENTEQQKYFGNTVGDNIRYMLTSEMLKPSLVIGITQFFAAAAPNSIFLFYLPLLMLKTDPTAPIETIMIIYTTSILFSHTVGVVLVPFLGKKRIILISMVGSASGCILLAVCDLYNAEIDNNYWIVTAVLVIMQCFMGIGPPNLAPTLAAEIFPLRGRVTGMGISTILGTIYTILITFLALPFLNYIQFYIIMLAYFGIYVLGFIYFNFFLIETEGKTLQQIQTEMSS